MKYKILKKASIFLFDDFLLLIISDMLSSEYLDNWKKSNISTIHSWMWILESQRYLPSRQLLKNGSLEDIRFLLCSLFRPPTPHMHDANSAIFEQNLNVFNTKWIPLTICRQHDQMTTLHGAVHRDPSMVFYHNKSPDGHSKCQPYWYIMDDNTKIAVKPQISCPAPSSWFSN